MDLTRIWMSRWVKKTSFGCWFDRSDNIGEFKREWLTQQHTWIFNNCSNGIRKKLFFYYLVQILQMKKKSHKQMFQLNIHKKFRSANDRKCYNKFNGVFKIHLSLSILIVNLNKNTQFLQYLFITIWVRSNNWFFSLLWNLFFSRKFAVFAESFRFFSKVCFFSLGDFLLHENSKVAIKLSIIWV